MPLPSLIRITSKASYEIVYVDSFPDETQVGECRKEPRQIVIKQDLSQTQTIKTVIHEILHAIEFESGYPIPHKLIYSLESSLWRIIKLNGWLK